MWLTTKFSEICLLGHTFGQYAPEQPSLSLPPLGQMFGRWIHMWKLMQHLEICLSTDYLPATEAYFSYLQLRFKIGMFLYCHHKMKFNSVVKHLFQFFKKTECLLINYWFFIEERVTKGFINGWVCESSCRL